VVSFTPRLLYPRGKSIRYPLDKRLGGPQSRSGRHGAEKSLTPAIQPVIIIFVAVAVSRSRDGSVGIVTGYRLDDRGDEVRVPIGSKIFSLHVVHTGSGAHPASYPMGTGGSFLWGKAAAT
jgi:hypothetical protein